MPLSQWLELGTIFWALYEDKFSREQRTKLMAWFADFEELARSASAYSGPAPT
jgi:hypothetical protein